MAATEIAALSHDPQARVMVFIDGQNLYFSCKKYFGHPLCHPQDLAASLVGPRKLCGVRYYTGRPSPDVQSEVAKVAQLDRRLDAMRQAGVTVQTRRLDYHWTWGISPRMPPPVNAKSVARNVSVVPYLRAQEKGIDMLIGLDVIEFAVLDAFDVAIIVSRDRDLQEIPGTIQNLRSKLRHPVRMEAAVVRPPALKGPVTLPGFHYTHQITSALFASVRDDTDYSAPPPPKPGLTP